MSKNPFDTIVLIFIFNKEEALCHIKERLDVVKCTFGKGFSENNCNPFGRNNVISASRFHKVGSK